MGIHEFFRDVSIAAEDGLTLAECGRLLGSLARLTVSTAEHFSSTGTAKKAWVMDRVIQLIEILVPAIPFPVWLRPFAPLIRAVIRRALLSLTDGLVEAAVDALKEKPV